MDKIRFGLIVEVTHQNPSAMALQLVDDLGRVRSLSARCESASRESPLCYPILRRQISS